MKTYIEYDLGDGSTLLIEADGQNEASGTVKVGRDERGYIIRSANQKFESALTSVTHSAEVLRQQLIELRADEVEVTFGLKAVGEAGNFAIGKVGVEANYTVKLKWGHEE